VPDHERADRRAREAGLLAHGIDDRAGVRDERRIEEVPGRVRRRATSCGPCRPSAPRMQDDLPLVAHRAAPDSRRSARCREWALAAGRRCDRPSGLDRSRPRAVEREVAAADTRTTSGGGCRSWDDVARIASGSRDARRRGCRPATMRSRRRRRRGARAPRRDRRRPGDEAPAQSQTSAGATRRTVRISRSRRCRDEDLAGAAGAESLARRAAHGVQGAADRRDAEPVSRDAMSGSRVQTSRAAS
jgi:hypothetical protein